MKLHFIHDWGKWQTLVPGPGDIAMGLRVQVSTCLVCDKLRTKNIFL